MAPAGILRIDYPGFVTWLRCQRCSAGYFAAGYGAAGDGV